MGYPPYALNLLAESASAFVRNMGKATRPVKSAPVLRLQTIELRPEQDGLYTTYECYLAKTRA